MQANFVPTMKITFVFMTMLLMFACKQSEHIQLEPKEFNQKISSGDVQLLDVRTTEEFNQGHIDNAMNIDIKSKEFDSKASGLYQDIPVYVYCKSGRRSSDAANRLKDMGFKEVYELKGGISAWNESGLPVKVVKPEPPPVDFKTAIQGDKLVLVDFNAVWCGPCKLLQPFVDRIHRERQEEVTVISIDTDDHPDLAMEYDVQKLPTIMLFKNGKVLERTIGLMEESELNALVDKHK
jgi:thioredoxin 1